MDLYKDDTLFFVKIGTPQKLNYVVDLAALHQFKILQAGHDFFDIKTRKSNRKSFVYGLF